ncbi:hypothetical protein G4G28_06595 [Massilia sp. Dwa41.01b]|uniref:hypothetical protein n=1 Tax=unclassified Massilia TaxID=2609279 RepID=UPI0015FFC420|nr:MULTISPECIES: hypothetical protein [unclassified Massilia]QNA88254.1 hypothetical protein G4G28_06595 [Massilia sp. Dwa41.01b]QNA99154.1 hypothetical protein G4G31_10320 [Massilia sp. Se16.2.3]
MAANHSNGLKTPLLVVCALIAICIALVIGVMIGALLPGTATAAPDSLSGWITTVATVVICVLTIVLAVETWRLRAAQARQIEEFILEGIRPNVSVELSGSHVGMNFMNVRVTNSGKGIAKKISFEFLDRLDQPVTAQNEPVVKVFHKLTMFRLGIESLGINQELKSFIFSFLDLEREIGVGAFTPFVNIRIRFEDTEGNEYVNSFVIDFAQYEGFSEIGGNSLHRLADEVKAIREQLSAVVSGNKRLAVNVHSSEDRAEEHTELINRLAEQRQRRSERQA